MIFFEILFWLFLFIVFYIYVGYGILLYFFVKVRCLLGLYYFYEGNVDYELEVMFFVVAYNEKDYVDVKVCNFKFFNYL